MFVSIDRTNMRFLHKHQTADVVGNLVWIEAPHVASYVCELSAPFLRSFTELEIRMLYRNTVGDDHISQVGDGLRAVLLDLAQRLPESDVVPSEAELQAMRCKEGDATRYQYVKGANVPAKQADLFEVPALQAPRAENEALLAATGWKWVSTDFTVRSEAPVVTSTEGQATSTPSEPRSQGRPKSGTTTGQVWEIADQLSALHADDKALRKAVVEECVAQGINKSTASVQFGHWKAARA